jgi:hypothetical protein
VILPFYFTFRPDWQTAPLAFWVHIPLNDAKTEFTPAAPVEVAHRGFAVLHVEVGEVELQFSSLPQLDHFIDVLDASRLPTTRQLSLQRGTSLGPNGHWLSRLPARLKAPRERKVLVSGLRKVRAELAPLGDRWDRVSHLLLARAP